MVLFIFITLLLQLLAEHGPTVGGGHSLVAWLARVVFLFLFFFWRAGSKQSARESGVLTCCCCCCSIQVLYVFMYIRAFLGRPSIRLVSLRRWNA